MQLLNMNCLWLKKEVQEQATVRKTCELIASIQYCSSSKAGLIKKTPLNAFNSSLVFIGCIHT